MAKVLFYTATWAKYSALTTKDASALYFITDRNQIYKGSDLYSPAVKVVETYPSDSKAASGQLYAKSSGQTKFYDGTKWVTVAGNLADKFLSNAVRHVVTAEEAGKGIYADCVEGDIGILFTVSDERGGSSTVQYFVKLTDLVDIYTGKDTHTVDMNVNGYEISANVKVSTRAGNSLEIISNSASEGLYVPPTVYTGSTGTAVDVSVDGDRQISATLNLSSDSGNIAVVKADGLYVPSSSAELSGKMDVYGSDSASQILLSVANGKTVTRSGKKIGGATLAETVDANTVATEAAVEAAIDAAIAWHDL